MLSDTYIDSDRIARLQSGLAVSIKGRSKSDQSMAEEKNEGKSDTRRSTNQAFENIPMSIEHSYNINMAITCDKKATCEGGQRGESGH